MPLTFRVETERGEPVSPWYGDVQGVLARSLPGLDDASSYCLRFVDPYGQTVFNHLQLTQFLAEVEQIRANARTPDEARMFERIEELVELCRSKPHRYFKFYGD
ncbi:MAG: hypothetical protein ACTHMJ_17030 [Thermomicrobiales bacterium]